MAKTDLACFPELPAARPVELADKAAYDAALAASPSPASDVTFTNVYLFRQAHAYRLARAHDCLVVLARGYDGTAYAAPPLGPGDRRAALAAAFTALAAEGAPPRLAVATADDLVALLDDPARYEVLPDRDNFDYLHPRRELAELPGNRFHRQKNLINRLARETDWESVPLAEAHAAEAARLAEEWFMIRGETRSASARLETEAAVEAVRLRRELGLIGQAILIHGRVEAFALGELLQTAEPTAVCHFEKANPRRVGLSQLIGREFAARAFPAAELVNREQDLGEVGLRQAKESYRPLRFVEKFRVRPRN